MENIQPVPTAAKRRLTKAVQQARVKLEELDNTVQLEQEALEAMKLARTIVGTECFNKGKISPFGHRTEDMNGRLDLALIKGEDILGCLRAMMRGNQARRKRKAKDNRTLVLRAQDHVRYLSGRTKTSRKVIRQRLAKIGKADKADQLMETMKPVAKMFDAYVKAGNY